MTELHERLELIEQNQLKASEDMKMHQLNDSLGFGKAQTRDEDAAKSREEMKTDIKEIKVLLTPITNAYNGILFSRKFFLGLVAIILAITALGGAIYNTVGWLHHG